MTNLEWKEIVRYLDELYPAAEGLERLFPGRKFTLDGHLVGSVGEVVAAYIFDLDLKSTKSHGHPSNRKICQGAGRELPHPR